MSKYLAAGHCATFLCATFLMGACTDDSGVVMMMPPPPPDTTLRTYDADDANIQYTGRIDASNAKLPKFSQGGVSMTARFKGIAVSAMVKDEHRYGKYVNHYDVILDGAPHGKITFDQNNDSATYPIAADLAYGEHQVTVVRRTEPTAGLGYFLGFQIAGEILPAPERPARRIEIIGDSITAGAGAASIDPADCTAPPDGWGLGVEDVYKSYGPVLAQSLAAEFQVIGVSGIGLVRDYSSNPVDDLRNMPQVYDLLFPQLTNSPTWDRASAGWVADAVVIGLGTNDYSPGDAPRPKMDQATWVAAYVAFVGALRAHYPNAHVFMISSALLGDGYPTPSDRSGSDIKDALTAIEDHFITAGDAKVHKVFVTNVVGPNCGHPNPAQHLVTAQEIAPAIKTALGW
jgi:lysophospholipase L1-like esterase